MSLYFLIITENVEYCSSLSISAGSLKLAIDILYNLLVPSPWSKVWNLNNCFLPKAIWDWIQGVVAYPYPSVLAILPLNSAPAADIKENCTFEPDPYATKSATFSPLSYADEPV